MHVHLNHEELGALEGQIPEIWQFYVVLKKFMDYRTGVVGVARGISWQSLTEELYVEPGQGLQGAGTPAKSKVRRLAERAVREALIEDRSEPRRLVFFLPLATADYSAQKKPGTNPAQTRHIQPGTTEVSNGAGYEPKTEKPGTVTNCALPQFSEKPDTPPDSGIRKEANASLSIVATAPPDAPAASAKKDRPTCPHEDLVELYHEMLPELPSIVWSLWLKSSDAKSLQARWNEDKRHQSLEFWQRFFATVRTNRHWMGQGQSSWKGANLRWLVKKENFIKVAELMVDNARRGASHG